MFILNLACLVLAGVAVGHHTGSALDGFAAAGALYVMMPWHPRAA